MRRRPLNQPIKIYIFFTPGADLPTARFVYRLKGSETLLPETYIGLEKDKVKEEALFRKFIANSCNPEEIEQVFACLKTSRSAKTVIHTLIAQELQQAARSGRGISPDLSENIRKKILEQIESQAPESAAHAAPVRPERRFGKRIYWKIAATLAGLLVLSAAGYRYFIDQPAVKHSTFYGEIARIMLPDSSTVVLNGNSEIRYGRDWESGPREVWVSGEAFFSVKHTSDDRKFIVHSSQGLDVEVLGTEFNLYNRADLTRVVLNEGKVKLNIKKGDSETSHVNMQPGELVELHENREYEKREVDPEYYNSWIRGQIVLNNTSFREIVVLLEETYGLSVDVPDTAIYSERFSGTVPSKNATTLLTALAYSFDLHVKAEGNKVIFKTKSDK